MSCERIYVLWEYRVWRRSKNDMSEVREADGAGKVEERKKMVG